METIGACPFCDGDGSLSILSSEKLVFCSCWSCGARGSVVQYSGDKPTLKDVERAIAGWNDRVERNDSRA